MLIKRIMLVAILATITNAAFGADLVDMGFVNQAAGEYGPQNNAITEAALDRVLEECRRVTDWNDASQLPLSSILRAQLSNDTTSAQLGNTEAFRRLFPVNGDDIAVEFKNLVAADSTQASRNAAIDRIQELRAMPIEAPAAAGISEDQALAYIDPLIKRWGGTPETMSLAEKAKFRNAGGATVLMASVGDGNYEMSEFLLRHGADKNAATNDGEVSIMSTARDNAPQLIELLNRY